MGDRAGEARALGVLGVVYGFLAQPAEAERRFRAALELFEQLGSAEGIVDALGDFSGMVFQPQGRHADELALLDAFMDRAQPRGNAYLIGSLHIQRALVLARLGHFELARATLQQPAVSGAAWMSPSVRVGTRIYLARLHTELGEYAQAEAMLGELLAATAGQPVRVVETAHQRLALAYNGLRQGAPQALQAGLAQAQQAVALLASTSWQNELAWARTELAQLLLALEDPGAALAATTAALANAQTMPAIPIQLHFVHAQALRANGQAEAARQHLAQAHAQVQEVAGRLADPSLRRAWLENVWINRLILADWARYGA